MNDVAQTLAERGKRYGDFTDHGAISQHIKAAMCGQANQLEPHQSNSLKEKMASLSPHMREALAMIAHKIARILNGDPNHADSWHDIAGYAKLVEERCPKSDSP